MKTLLVSLIFLPAVLFADEEEKPKVAAQPTVETVIVNSREFHPDVVLFGVAATPPNASLTITIPAEAKVRSQLVHAGQAVAAGTPLLEIEPPLDFQLAQNAAEIAAQTLESAQKRFDLKLIPIADWLAAKQAAAEARLKFSHFLSTGLAPDGKQVLAPSGGTVLSLPANPGDTVAAAEPLVQMLTADTMEVRGGLPPEATVEMDGLAKVTAIGRSEPLVLAGKVQSVSRALNPETHLLDVVVSLPEPGGLHAGESVRVAIPGPARTALLVPKTALRSEEGETLVFTLKAGKAERHVVETGSAEDDQMEVTSGGIVDGAEVVTVGNSQLSDGMDVTKATAKPAEKE